MEVAGAVRRQTHIGYGRQGPRINEQHVECFRSLSTLSRDIKPRREVYVDWWDHQTLRWTRLLDTGLGTFSGRVTPRRPMLNMPNGEVEPEFLRVVDGPLSYSRLKEGTLKGDGHNPTRYSIPTVMKRVRNGSRPKIYLLE